MNRIVGAAATVALALLIAACTPSLSKVYLLSFDGVTIGVYTTQQGANEKQASFSADDQKRMQITPMEVTP